MSSLDVERLLNEWGLGWQPGKTPNLWWIGAAGEHGNYQIRLYLDDQQLVIAHTFDQQPIREDAETLLLLLEANDRVTVFKFALDERARAVILATWPAGFLTADNLGFLLTDLVVQIDRFHEDIVARLASAE